MNKLRIRKGEVIQVGKFMSTGWIEPIDFYAWICRDCNQLVVNYPTTQNQTLKCPICLDKQIKEYLKGEPINDSLPL